MSLNSTYLFFPPLVEVVGDPFQDMNEGMFGIMRVIVDTATIASGIGALISLCLVVYKMYSGDREAGMRMIWWGVGLLLVFILLMIIKELYHV